MWLFLDHNFKAIIITIFLGALLATGAYNIQSFIDMIERVAINLSECK